MIAWGMLSTRTEEKKIPRSEGSGNSRRVSLIACPVTPRSTVARLTLPQYPPKMAIQTLSLLCRGRAAFFQKR